jgi:hypothetical protein
MFVFSFANGQVKTLHNTLVICYLHCQTAKFLSQNDCLSLFVVKLKTVYCLPSNETSWHGSTSIPAAPSAPVKGQEVQQLK